MDNFNLKWKNKDEYPVIFMEGDITSSSEKLLIEAYKEINESTKDSQIIIFNFENVNYINSSGISSIIKLLQMQKNKNGDFIFIGLSDHFKKVMDIVGLTDFITIYDSYELFMKRNV